MNTKTKLNALALAVAFTLAACGGGSDDDKNASKPVEVAPAGDVAKLPSDTFIMTAVDGDTFTITFDRSARVARISPLNTMFGVEEVQNIPVKIFDTNLGITAYASDVPDNGEGSRGPWFEIYTSPDGNEIVGQVDIAGLRSNVIGTNLKINGINQLPIQGAYNGVSMEAESAYAKKKLIDFGIKSEGGSMTFCENGFYANSTCTGTEYQANFSTTYGGMAQLQVNFNGRYRSYAYLLLAKNGNGYSLILDRLQNADGRSVYGTGYAVPATEFSLTDTVKSFACIKQDASGGSYLSLRQDRTYSEEMYDDQIKPVGSKSGLMALNKAVSGGSVVNAQGIVSFIQGTAGMPSNPTTKFTRGLNFSKNMLVLADEETQSLSVCRSDSLVAK